jgi:hypothetical protein
MNLAPAYEQWYAQTIEEGKQLGMGEGGAGAWHQNCSADVAEKYAFGRDCGIDGVDVGADSVDSGRGAVLAKGTRRDRGSA